VKVGDLVKHRIDARIPPLVGMVIEVASDNDRRVKWFIGGQISWVSQKSLETVSEGR
jgi:hypothetical protein